MAGTNDFHNRQPRSAVEMKNVAAEALGQSASDEFPHSPRFHSMSITSAENGYSVDHTMEEPEDNDRNRNPGDPFEGQGPRRKTKTHVITAHHPAYHHVHAIHDAITAGTKPKGQGFQLTPQHPSGPQNR